MKLDLKGIRLAKCEYKNEMGPNFKMNLQVSMNNQIQLPKPITANSSGKITTKVMVGTPMLPLYLYVEQISVFADSEPDANLELDNESLMSLYKTICVPIAMKKLQESLDQLCEVYRIPKITLANGTNNNTNTNYRN